MQINDRASPIGTPTCTPYILNILRKDIPLSYKLYYVMYEQLLSSPYLFDFEKL